MFGRAHTGTEGNFVERTGLIKVPGINNEFVPNLFEGKMPPAERYRTVGYPLVGGGN